MKKIVGYLTNYLSGIDKKIFFLSSLFIAFGIFINYHFKIEKAIVRLPFLEKYAAWFLIFLIAFSFPYILYFLFRRKIVSDPKFFILLFIAPALFAWKLSGNIHFDFIADEQQNKYWNQ